MGNIETKIGKDVIESLTLGMYEDSRFIYREYIQNGADQIDKAVAENLISSLRDAKIEIEINPATKTISIYDNATGIESDKVEPILKNIAQSTKDRSKDKGFRGIGRLGGLGYCNKLIFETTYKDEEIKSYLVWDAQKLKEIINNRSTKEEATWVIDSVTNFYTEKEKPDSHYFKVTLEGVSNDILLDKDCIYQYLSMVAPCPYGKGFIFKSIIYDKAKELDCQIDEYPVFVNGDQIFKSYTTSLYQGDNGNKRKMDEIYDIETYEIRTSKNKLLAWGWYSLSKFEKVIPGINPARSIRLRKGNIQIGSEDALVSLFKEPRGTKYFFGEIHAVSQELIPNARRDYFLENSELKDFEKRVRIKFDELHKLYYFSSKVRNEKKKIDDLEAFTATYDEKSKKNGFTNNKEKREFEEKYEVIKEKAESAEKELEKIKGKTNIDTPTQKKVYEKVVGEQTKKVSDLILDEDNGKTKYITDDIPTLNRKDRKLVSKILSVIDVVLVKDLAENLKKKIIEELNK